MAESTTYPKTPTNTVNRYKHQATYDTSTIHSIINTTPVLHVSFLPTPTSTAPIILPMIGQMGLSPQDEAAGETDWKCYLHGYVSSRLMNLTASASGSPEASAEAEAGLPMSIAATKVDGFVLSLTPYTHNYNYRSAVLQGTASIVTNPAEKLWALELLTNSMIPDQYAHTRVPPDNAELQSTRILKLRVEAASGKVRYGWPEDERKDMKREDVLDTVWTGVVPVYQTLGEPVAGPYNRVYEVPEYVRGFVERENRERMGYAREAAGREPKSKRGKREG